MPDHDRESSPWTEPHPAPIFDTGPHPQPLPGGAAGGRGESGTGAGVALAEPRHTALVESGADSSTPPTVSAATSVLVPGRYHFLKWWQLALIFAAVWIPAGGIGLGMFSWWYSALDKTPVLYAVFSYVVVCMVAGLLLAMVPDKPLAAAFALAVMSAVFVAAAAAAPLYGHYFCQVQGPCLAGIVPY